MKKICFLTSVHSAFDVRIFHKEAKTLVKAGYDVTLIAQHDKNEAVDGIRIIPLPKPKNRFERITRTACALFGLALRQKADVYHFHDPELIPVGLLLKLFTRTKVIYDVHEDVPQQILSKFWLPRITRKALSILFDRFEKAIARKFDYVITATPNIKTKFKQGNIRDIRNYPVVTNSWLSINYGSPGDKNHYTLIYVGLLEKSRGIKQLIQSLKFLSNTFDVKLELLGRFSDENFEREVRRLLEQSNKVELLGWIQYEKTIEHLRKADIGLACLQPADRFKNNLGLKLFEYMAAGLPVIASDFPLWRELIEVNACGVMVDPLDPKDIAKAIEYLLSNPDLIRTMGENGRKAVFEKYNWEMEANKLLDLYRSITNSSEAIRDGY